MATTNELVVRHKVGLHARPAAVFVKAASGFASQITVENLTKGKAPVNAKSILGVLSAAVQMKDQIRITATGSDEAAAVATLSDLITTNFGED
ncbi:MAG TPA: HPr family phosphocarrier protein [Ktedonosporobacter sp.]|nr:HPr family phosphocarrier protein [Ktedonosporobacter sp.]